MKMSLGQLYHGSPDRLRLIEPSKEHGDSGVGDVVFATPYKEMALGYLGRAWGDRDLAQGSAGGKGWYLTEMRPGALEDIYGGIEGYLHEVPDEPFEKRDTKGSTFEVVSDETVKPTKIRKIKNILRAMRKAGISLHKYDPKSEEYKRALGFLRRRVAKMEEEGRKEYLAWIREANPELADKLEKTAQVAPGLPSMENLGRAEELRPGLAPWVIQRHLAQRAGPHYDIRIGNPYGMLMSWAARHLPEKPGEKRLAIQQPLHEGQYADFEGELKSRYGRGTVKKHDRGEVLITDVKPDKISFVLAHKRHPQRFTLVRTRFGSKSWLMVNTTPEDVVENKKIHYTKVPAKDVEKLFNEDYLASAKIDGAAALVKLMGDKIEVLSYRTTKEGKPIHHTLRLAGKPIKAKIPKELQGKVLRGELYGQREGQAIPAQELGGILNTTLAKALKKQRETGTSLRVALYDILGEEEQPYEQTQEKLKSALEHLPKEYFEVEEPEKGEKAIRALWEKVISGQHPKTREGLVFRHRRGGKPIKVVPRPESDVYVREVKEGPQGGALFAYSLTPGGPVVGRVGSGFSAETQRDMLADPQSWIGRRARIESKEQFPSGAHRAPAFIALHEDYPMADAEDEDKEIKVAQVLSDKEKEDDDYGFLDFLGHVGAGASLGGLAGAGASSVGSAISAYQGYPKVKSKADALIAQHRLTAEKAGVDPKKLKRWERRARAALAPGRNEHIWRSMTSSNLGKGLLYGVGAGLLGSLLWGLLRKYRDRRDEGTPKLAQSLTPSQAAKLNPSQVAALATAPEGTLDPAHVRVHWTSEPSLKAMGYGLGGALGLGLLGRGLYELFRSETEEEAERKRSLKRLLKKKAAVTPIRGLTLDPAAKAVHHGAQRGGRIIQQAAGESPRARFGVAGAGAGALAGLLHAYFTDEDKKKKSRFGGGWQDYLKKLLVGAGIGGATGLAAGQMYKSWLDPKSMSPEYKQAIEGKEPTREDWRKIYLETVKDPAAKKYFMEHPDDPNHPANKVQDLIEAFKEDPDVGYGRWTAIPRSKALLDIKRKPSESYRGQTEGGWNLQDLKDLGFFPSAVVVPEIGQARWMTYRHPETTMHWHRHHGRWSYHLDALPSSQVLMARLKRRGYNPYTASNLARATVYGLPHAIGEGLPGWLSTGVRWVADRPGIDTELAIHEGVPREQLRGVSYGRPDVVARRLGLALGLPAAAYLGAKAPGWLQEYLAEKERLLVEEEKEKRRKARLRKKRKKEREAKKLAQDDDWLFAYVLQRSAAQEGASDHAA